MDGENSERSLDTMGASRRAPQLIAALACLVAVPAAAAAPTSPPTERVDASTEEEPRWVMTPASTELIRAAAAPHELLSSIAPGWVWRSLSVERSSARLVLTHDDPPAERATLTLQHPETATTEELLGRGPTLAVILEAADDDGRAAAAILGQALLAADRAGALAELWTERPTPVVAPIVAAEPPPPRPEIVAEEDEEPALTSDERRHERFSALWLALAVGLLTAVVATLRAAGRSALTWLAPLTALTLLALGLRWGLATWGPGDLHTNLASALPGVGTSLDGHYGFAPAGLLKPLQAVTGAGLPGVIVVNMILGSLAPLVMVALARALGLDRASSLFAGLVLAIHPLLVRHGGEANRQAIVLFTGLVATWAMARHASSGRLEWLALVMVAAALCLGARPEAVFLLALLPFSLLARAPASGHGLHPLRRGAEGARGRGLIVIALLAGGWLIAWAQVFAMPQLEAGAHELAHDWRTMWTDPTFTPLAIIALFFVGLIGGWRAREPLVLWAIPALVVIWLLTSPFSLRSGQLCSARYHTLSLILVAVLAARGLARASAWVERRRPRSQRLVTPALALLLALTTWWPLRFVTAPRSEEHEFALLLELARELPPGSTVYIPEPEHDVMLKEYENIPFIAGVDQRWRSLQSAAWSEVTPDTSRGPSYFYYPGSCASHRRGPAYARECEEGLARFGHRPVRRATLPGTLNTLMGERDPSRQVEVGLYRMDD